MLPPPFPHHHLSSTAWSILHLKWNHLPNLLMHPPSPSNPCLTSFCYLQSLRVSDFGWRPLSIVSSFFCVLTYQCISSCLILQLSIKWLVLDLHCGTQRTVGTCSCSMCLSSCILENLFGVDHLPTLWHHWVTLIQAEDQWVNVSLMPVVQLDVIHAQEIADYYSTNLLWICIKNTYRLVVGKSFTNGKWLFILLYWW